MLYICERYNLCHYKGDCAHAIPHEPMYPDVPTLVRLGTNGKPLCPHCYQDVWLGCECITIQELRRRKLNKVLKVPKAGDSQMGNF